jgi:hypothetical protein
MSVREGAEEALFGIIIGFVPILIKAVSFQNADTLIGILELGALIGAINSLDTIQQIPVKTALGYFIVTFTIGFLFMPEWERGLQLILLIVYIVAKLGL